MLIMLEEIGYDRTDIFHFDYDLASNFTGAAKKNSEILEKYLKKILNPEIFLKKIPTLLKNLQNNFPNC